MLDENGRKIFDKLKIADKFNEYFIGTSKSLETNNSAVQPSPMTMDSYLNMSINTEFKFSSINENQLDKIMKDIKTKNSNAAQFLSTSSVKKVYLTIKGTLLNHIS